MKSESFGKVGKHLPIKSLEGPLEHLAQGIQTRGRTLALVDVGSSTQRRCPVPRERSMRPTDPAEDSGTYPV